MHTVSSENIGELTLSNTTTQSAFNVNLFRVKIELYGCTTTSLWLWLWLGKTE